MKILKIKTNKCMLNILLQSMVKSRKYTHVTYLYSIGFTALHIGALSK